MATISDFASLSIGLSVNPPSQANFTVPILFVDHADVPLDKRYRIVTRSSYATDLTASTDQSSWCASLWGQNYNPSQAYIGRWASSATLAHAIQENATSVASVYTALAATSKFNLVEGASDEDISPDFTADVTMADVCASIQTALAASTLGEHYTCSLDVYDRPVIWSDLSGAAASESISIGSPSSGVDLSGAAYLGSSTSIAGIDAETLGAAASAVFALDNTPFIVCERGGSIAQKVAFATSMNSLDKLLLLVSNDTDAKDSGESGDFGYQIEALGYNKCYLMYTEHTTQNPDAAICGEVFPQTEATVNLALTPLTGLSQSGLAADGTTVIPITATEAAALVAKGYDYLVKPATVTHFVHGLAPGGNEIRIMVGKMFCEAKVNEDVYAYLIANSVVTFGDDDISAIKGIVEKWLGIMVERKVLEAGYTITMPEASDFSAATKATHVMDLDDVTTAETQRSVNKVNITLSWSV